ncbi:hypothetical protein SAMN05421736_105240 [Evansella caseinilytica]|uniref:Uncharacterized protein n=1 Tax=Evansella caseinilytica TaxID=1503961 RepID=A0A1H3PVL5_9BACI|nr:hypothetical protein [Evansella caseinilytica]SDZ05324.1 hypothetical protein SAMN05421736_105240 [Evansella caseinilytica]
MHSTAIITAAHDPKGRSVPLFNELKTALVDIYAELFITISEETSNELMNALENSRFKTNIIPKSGAAHARREMMNFGLTGESQHFH